jgi:hypothetical protein
MSNSVFGLRLGDAEHQFLEQAAADTDGILSKAGVARVLIRHAMTSGWQPLDKVSNIATCSAGAGNPGNNPQKLPLQFPPNLEVTSSEAPTEAVPSKKKNSLETLSLIPKLEKFDDLIREFFRLKKGSKSKTAWAHLMTGLTKIQDKYGDDVVKEQLMAAINGRWAGITLKNYEEFGKAKPKPAWQQEAETKHPAYRVVTAESLEEERNATIQRERERQQARLKEEEKHNFLGF